MSKPFKAGLVQMCSGADPERNARDAARLIRKAAGAGAKLVLTPEMTGLFESRGARMRKLALPERDDPSLQALPKLAKELGIWLVIGSLPVRVSRDWIANRSYLVSDQGEIAATYDKIHMFDVNLGPDLRIRESRTYRAGDQAVVAKTPFGVLGMSVCYDLRFPYLYRRLAEKGAGILAVPSAFTVPTGKAHWQVLVRARAIENGAFVLAPAQAGRHADGRETFGHSLAVDPWGRVLADGGAKKTNVVVADIDPAMIREARRKIPSLKHTRAVKG